eukprot:TRINITY_DN1846_c0_g1_i5.p4 TRINITY_DN1846_c0_g1~~TRINITY_DN1846_c0_g1_i5.p4  ORF type:complete len:151 (-),score=31.15 TRINITY_DN1846_c0_g1_i5:503-955(-)
MSMKILFIIMAVMVLSPLLDGDNSKLVAEKVKELKQLNDEILKQIKDVGKYQGKQIYVKVKVLPAVKENGKTVLKVEKVSVDKIEKDPEEITGKFIYLTGMVSKSDTKNKFNVDLSHVLPPEEEEEDDDVQTGKKSESTEKDSKKESGKK